jgi:hypothetical protein
VFVNEIKVGTPVLATVRTPVHSSYPIVIMAGTGDYFSMRGVRFSRFAFTQTVAWS